MRRRPRHRFEVGNILFDSSTKKFHVVERLKTHFGIRYLLRSLESDNPGQPKSGAYIDNQLADGVFKILTHKQYLRETR